MKSTNSRFNRTEQDLREKVLSELDKRDLVDEMNAQGNIIFLALTGAHSYGFPSEDSDYDIRGVFKAPTEDFLGIKKTPDRTFSHMSEDRTIDIALDEIGHYLSLIANSNGNRLEWQNSIIIYESPEFQEFRETVLESGVSKALFNHYLNFSRNLAEGGRTEEQSVKTDLYAVRAMLTGIHLLKTGEVQPDVAELAMLYDVPIVERMIDDKRQSEIGDPISYDRKELAETLNRLEGELENALQESTLPEKPGYEKLNDYLIEHRKGGL